MFGPDGTQAPPPPRVFPDPLAGLIAADSAAVRPVRLPVAQPVIVSPTEDVRRAIEAQMAHEQARSRQRRRPAAPRAAHIPAHVPPQMPMPVAPAASGQPEQKTSDTTSALLGCGCLLLLVVGVVVIVVALFG